MSETKMDVDKEEETLSAMTVSQVKQWLEDVAGGIFKFLAPKNHRSGELLVLLTVDQCCDWCENQGGIRDLGVDLWNVIQKARSLKAHSQPASAGPSQVTLLDPLDFKKEEIRFFPRFQPLQEVVPGQPAVLPRERLIQNVLAMLQTVSVVLINSPPGTGKSSLVNLLRPRVAAVTLVRCGLYDRSPNDPFWLAQRIAADIGLQHVTIPSHLRRPDKLLIFDDAQCIFENASFWADLVKGGGHGPVLALCTSFPGLSSPSPFDFPCKMFYGDMLISTAECEQILEQLCIYYGSDSHQVTALRLAYPMLLRDVQAHEPESREDPVAHIGLMRDSLITIATTFMTRTGLQPSVDSVSKYLMGKLHDAIGTRFFPYHLLRDHELAVLKQVISYYYTRVVPVITNFADRSNGHYDLCKAAVLVGAVGQPLRFATNFHFRHAFRSAYPTKTYVEPVVSEDGVDEWILQVISTFERSVLCDQQCWAAGGLPKEGVFQQMFHRGASLKLPPTMHITPEMSKRYGPNNILVAEIKKSDSGATGELDFFINSKLELAVELLIDGQDKAQHINTVQTDYQAVLPKFSRIIDFRKEKRCNNPHCPLYVAVNFSADFSTAEVTFFRTHRKATLYFN